MESDKVTETRRVALHVIATRNGLIKKIYRNYVASCLQLDAHGKISYWDYITKDYFNHSCAYIRDEKSYKILVEFKEKSDKEK